MVGWAAWMDSAILDQAGIPTVIFGPDGDGAHEAVEWVDLASVERCAEVLVAVAARVLRLSVSVDRSRFPRRGVRLTSWLEQSGAAPSPSDS